MNYGADSHIHRDNCNCDNSNLYYMETLSKNASEDINKNSEGDKWRGR